MSMQNVTMLWVFSSKRQQKPNSERLKLIIWHGDIIQYALESVLEYLRKWDAKLGLPVATCNISDKDVLSTLFLWCMLQLRSLWNRIFTFFGHFFIHTKEDLLKGHVEMRRRNCTAYKTLQSFHIQKIHIIYINNSQNNTESGSPNTSHHFRQYTDLCIHRREQAKCHTGWFSPNKPSTPLI